MGKITRKKLNVSIHSVEDPELRVMRGKAMYDSVDEDFKFVENPPCGARSKEVGRTIHGRMVQRPDGNYTITLRAFDPKMKYMRETLVGEVNTLLRLITEGGKK